MNILTATNGRPEIAEVWCAAIAATLTTPHEATVLWNASEPSCSCRTERLPSITPIIGMALDNYTSGPVRMFLEEDMIPVCPWSVDDYPGRLVAAQGNESGQPWPSLVIKRDEGDPATAIVPQRFVRDGGCPEWLPAELCEAAMMANAKVLGNHFIHLDKMYRKDLPEMPKKNSLLELLRERYPNTPTAQSHPEKRGLGDLVASGLSAVGITKERVSQIVGKDCGCTKRQQALNELGKKFGIG